MQSDHHDKRLLDETTTFGHGPSMQKTKQGALPPLQEGRIALISKVAKQYEIFNMQYALQVQVQVQVQDLIGRGEDRGGDW